ncbi:MAG: FecR family protein [Hyphomicrobiales bacterium]
MTRLTGLGLALSLAIASSTALAAERIGVASSVTSTVTGSIGGRTGALSSGDAVYQRQVISADDTGSAQLLFLDETVFSVGARANVTLDEFIYNPSQSAGRVVFNVTKGAFRFISGSAKPETYEIRTPVATIGVRGTIFSGTVWNDLFMSLQLLEGQILVCVKEGAKLEGAGIDKQESFKRNNEECYLINPGKYQVGFGPLDEPGGPAEDDVPGGDNPNDGADDAEDDNFRGDSNFIESDGFNVLVSPGVDQ